MASHGPIHPDFFDFVADSEFNGQFSLAQHRPDTGDYLDLALMSGFTQCLKRSTDRSRTAWLNSYIDHLLGRDVELIGEVREPLLFRRYLNAHAANTAESPDAGKLIRSVGLRDQLPEQDHKADVVLYTGAHIVQLSAKT